MFKTENEYRQKFIMDVFAREDIFLTLLASHFYLTKAVRWYDEIQEWERLPSLPPNVPGIDPAFATPRLWEKALLTDENSNQHFSQLVHHYAEFFFKMMAGPHMAAFATLLRDIPIDSISTDHVRELPFDQRLTESFDESCLDWYDANLEGMEITYEQFPAVKKSGSKTEQLKSFFELFQLSCLCKIEQLKQLHNWGLGSADFCYLPENAPAHFESHLSEKKQEGLASAMEYLIFVYCHYFYQIENKVMHNCHVLDKIKGMQEIPDGTSKEAIRDAAEAYQINLLSRVIPKVPENADSDRVKDNPLYNSHFQHLVLVVGRHLYSVLMSYAFAAPPAMATQDMIEKFNAQEMLERDVETAKKYITYLIKGASDNVVSNETSALLTAENLKEVHEQLRPNQGLTQGQVHASVLATPRSQKKKYIAPRQPPVDMTAVASSSDDDDDDGDDASMADAEKPAAAAPREADTDNLDDESTEQAQFPSLVGEEPNITGDIRSSEATGDADAKEGDSNDMDEELAHHNGM